MTLVQIYNKCRMNTELRLDLDKDKSADHLKKHFGMDLSDLKKGGETNDICTGFGTLQV